MLDFAKYGELKSVRLIYPDHKFKVQVPYSDTFLEGYWVWPQDLYDTSQIDKAKDWARNYINVRSNLVEKETNYNPNYNVEVTIIKNDPFKLRVIDKEYRTNSFIYKAITNHNYVIDFDEPIFTFCVYRFGICKGGIIDTDFVFAKPKSKSKKLVALPLAYFDEQMVQDIIL